ncbi:MAG: excinuclease ABC subunit UvrC [Candidatus Eremiobacteraeota bacterium]|nr:excinuclease ABC subunit UvrC [Candidatus Eremiobacteraeota bacterium]
MEEISDALTLKLSNLPDSSGVYLMKDKDSAVIYVGKAKSLKNRVSSYFQESRDHAPRISYLVRQIRDLDFIVTRNELEALILEYTLIKKYRPHFNVRLKDDKRYPLIEVTFDDDFPRVHLVRKKTGKRNRVFGPYTDSGAVRKVLTVLRKNFLIRSCKDHSPKRQRPCLNYQIHQCSGPCAGLISAGAYGRQVEKAMMFLSGHSSRLLRSLYRQMDEESRLLHYEKCTLILSHIRSIEKVEANRKVLFAKTLDRDYIAFSSMGKNVCAEVLLVREGRLMDEHYFIFSAPEDSPDEELARIFILHYYGRGTSPAPEIHMDTAVTEHDLLEEWLTAGAGRKVRIVQAPGGKSAEILAMARENAVEHLQMEKATALKKSSERLALLEELKELLGLPSLPLRIETYDISNISGKFATGSMVVFTRGGPDKASYRHFRIRCKETPDDVAMMRELLERRFTVKDGADGKEAWKASLPDLVLLDGGKGQLSMGMSLFEEMALEIPLVSLAKKNEELYRSPGDTPLILPKDSRLLHLMQHMRDESHRFAVTYHRKLRSRELHALFRKTAVRPS